MRYWPYALIAFFGVALPLACSDDETTTSSPAATSSKASSTSSASSGTGGAGMGGGGGCVDPANCVHCGAVLDVSQGYGPDDLCCSSQPTFGAFLDCACVEMCGMQCGDNGCMGNMPSQECYMCLGMNCGAESAACAADCPMGTPGCDAAGGAGGMGGAGGN